MISKRKSCQRHCQIGLPRAGRPDAEGNGISPDGVHIELLPQSPWTDGISALGEIDNIVLHVPEKLLLPLIHETHHQKHLPLRQPDPLPHHMAQPLHHRCRLCHRFILTLHADEIAPAGHIDAVMVTNHLQIRTVSLKDMGRFLLVPDQYFFYPFRNHFPFYFKK